MHKQESVLENETHKTLWGIWETNRPPNLGQMARLSDSKNKKRTSRTIDFAVPVYLGKTKKKTK